MSSYNMPSFLKGNVENESSKPSISKSQRTIDYVHKNKEKWKLSVVVDQWLTRIDYYLPFVSFVALFYIYYYIHQCSSCRNNLQTAGYILFFSAALLVVIRIFKYFTKR